jgi:hypothetical protein
MPQFLFKLSLLFPLLAGMVWVNWSIDPAILLPEHRDDPTRHPYENIIARDLLSGHPHRLKGLHLELVVDELVFRARPEIDTIVFGTSIAKPIHAGLFGGPNFFNASVTGGRIEEMIMAYQLALECGLKPRHVLIEVDSRSLGPRGGVPDSKLFERGLRRLNLPVEIQRDSVLRRLWRAIVPGEDTSSAANVRGAFYPYDELLSPRYFQFTMAYLAKRWLAQSDKPRELVSQFGESNESLMYPDGSLEWWDNALAQTPESVRQNFAQTNAASLAGLQDRPIAEKTRMYEAFVDDLVRSGIEVEFLLLPPNPWIFEQARQAAARDGKELPSVETEGTIRSLAAKYQLRVRGSLDPRHLGVTEADYIDDVHLRHEAMERILHAGH